MRLAGALGLPDLRNAALNSAFHYSQGDEGGAAGSGGDAGDAGENDDAAAWSVWGRASARQFDGSAGGAALDGELRGLTLGADVTRGRWLAGAALSLADGEGLLGRAGAPGQSDPLNQAGALNMQSTLTSLHPFVRYAAGGGRSMWAAAGYGEGRARVGSGGASVEADLENAMAAFGGRGPILSSGAFELALVSDARWNRSRWGADAGGTLRLLAGDGEASRIRVLIEGARQSALESGATLRPRFEAGLRYDGGDAETGAGVEVGVGLDYASGRFGLELSARGLLAHEDADYSEWGVGGSLHYRSLPDGSGLSVNLSSSLGSLQGRAQSMWSQQTARGLAPGGAFDAASAWGLRVGYGLLAPRGALWTPYMHAGSAAAPGSPGAGPGSLGAGPGSLGAGFRVTSGERLDANMQLSLTNTPEGEAVPGFELSGRYIFR